MENALDLWKSDGIEPYEAGRLVCSFLDTSTTSYGRATHYNTKEQQKAAEMTVHRSLFEMCRDLYAVLLLLPGTTDHARQIGISALLSRPRNGDMFLNSRLEREVLAYLIGQLPPQRMMKLFDSFRGRGDEFGTKKSNNARTRKLVLWTLLSSERIELWSVKYRQKMQRILTHVWGQRRASIIGSICARIVGGYTLSRKETQIMQEHVWRFTGKNSDHYVSECIAFLFGLREGLEIPLFKMFVNSRYDLEAGAKLPTEVLEGIRSIYHPMVPKEKVLELKSKSKTFTRGERRTVQKRAKEAGLDVEMNPLDYNAVDLYLYAFECGATQEIQGALMAKAEHAAMGMPVQYEHIGIVVDASQSMAGDRTQHLRPLAVTLALRDMLEAASTHGTVVYCGGELENDVIVRPSGDTSLAEGLLAVLQEEPDIVYVISDGYENAPAGRFQDVLLAARELGIQTPVFHLNPVFAGESEAVRMLCEDVAGISTMPVRTPTGLGTTMLRGLIEADPERGINMLVQNALTGCDNQHLALLGGGEA